MARLGRSQAFKPQVYLAIKSFSITSSWSFQVEVLDSVRGQGIAYTDNAGSFNVKGLFASEDLSSIRGNVKPALEELISVNSNVVLYSLNTAGFSILGFGKMPMDTQGAWVQNTNFVIDAAANIKGNGWSLSLEELVAARGQGLMPAEELASVVGNAQVPEESHSQWNKDIPFLLTIAASMNGTYAFQIEPNGLLRASTKLALEELSSVQVSLPMLALNAAGLSVLAFAKMLVDTRATLNFPWVILTDDVTNMRVSGVSPMDASSAIKRDAKLVQERLTIVRRLVTMYGENSQTIISVLASRNFPLETLLQHTFVSNAKMLMDTSTSEKVQYKFADEWLLTAGRTQVMPTETAGGIAGNANMPFEIPFALMRMSYAFNMDTSVAVTKQSKLLLEMIGFINADKRVPMEFIGNLRAQAAMLVETAGKVQVNQPLQEEVLASVRPTNWVFPNEYLSALIGRAQMPFELIGRITSTLPFNIETHGLFNIQYGFPVVVSQLVNATAKYPMELTGLIRVDQESIFPLEFIGQVQQQYQFITDASASIRRNATFLEDAGVAAAVTLAMRLEELVTCARSVQMPVELLFGTVSRSVTFPNERIADLRSKVSMPVEALAGAATKAILQLEALVSASRAAKMALEELARVSGDAKMPWDMLAPIRSNTVFALENLTASRSAAKAVLEELAAQAGLARIPLLTAGNLVQNWKFPVEGGVLAHASLYTLQIEHLLAVVEDARMLLSTLGFGSPARERFFGTIIDDRQFALSVDDRGFATLVDDRQL